MVIKNDQKKQDASYILRWFETPGNWYVSPTRLRKQLEVSGLIEMENELAGEREEAKTRVEHEPRKCKNEPKLRPPFWDGLWNRVSHQTRTHKDKTNEQIQ